MIDVSNVVDAITEGGSAAVAVAVSSLLCWVIIRGYEYIQLALIVRDASREYDERYGGR